MTTPAHRLPKRPLPAQPALFDTNAATYYVAPGSPSAHQDIIRRLLELIAARGMGPSELSARTGMRDALIEGLLQGRVVPPLSMLERLLDALDAQAFHRRYIRRCWEQLQHPDGPERSRHIVVRASTQNDIHRLRQDVAGYELQPDPLTATSKEEFLSAMREFHVWAGEPSYREIALNAGKTVGASTLCEALDPNKPARLPTLKVVTAFIYGCGGGEEDLTIWTTAWRRVRMARTATSVTHLATADQWRVS
ncbi:helix-turn-helix domain-containing protein [Nonomuraea sp. NPDC003709]|uniref:helix-turn-helix domain-containing protein n=1 Tax=Nonomuraea sp. NPDC003709 TaxID=3154450 RepID=UPI0033A95342